MKAASKVNPFKEYQKQNISEKEAKIRDAIKDAKKNRLRISYSLISKMTGIPYPTLKGRTAAGKHYSSIIDAAMFEGRTWDDSAKSNSAAPKNLEEAKALLNIYAYKLETLRTKNEELANQLKNPRKLLESLGFLKGKQGHADQALVAKDFCHLVERLMETNHLVFDDNFNIVPKGFRAEIRVPRALAEVYLKWQNEFTANENK